MIDTGYLSFSQFTHFFPMADLDPEADDVQRLKLDLMFDQHFYYDR